MSAWGLNWNSHTNPRAGFSSGYHSQHGLGDSSFPKTSFHSQSVSITSSVPAAGYYRSSSGPTPPDSTVPDPQGDSDEDVLDAIVEWQSI